ncbi:MAG TPA: PAS domain-containing protein, partial [Thermodesulfovibrionales bacterium]|nr:PAS domain-containing protein [Thermodesulfovibrionales bacterium]
MNDKDKTKEELIGELSELRRIDAELKAALAAAMEEKTRTEDVIAALGDAVSIQDTDFRILYQNQVSKEMYGNHVGEYCYRGYKNQDQVCEPCHLAQTFADGQIHRAEQSRKTDKGIRYYDKTSSPLKDSSGKIIAGIELVRDITERKKTEDILRLSQRVLDTSPDHISIVGPDYIYKHVNRAYTTAHDLPVDQIVGRHVAELLGRDIFEKTVKPNLDRCLAGEEIHYAAWFSFKGKGNRYMSVKYLPMRNKAGEIDGINVFSQDITERKKAEEALQESESHFRKVVENSPLCMALVGMDGIIEYINLKAIETFGYLPQDIPDMDSWWVKAYPDKTYREEVIAQWTSLVNEALENKHEIEQREYRVTCKNGSVKVMVIFGVWIADKVLVIFDDITERKQLEQEMIKAQKLEAIGTLAGGIAHDFNNLLQGIFGHISMAKMTLDRKDRSLALLEQAERALHMSVNPTTQLLTFAKGGKPVKSIVHLEPL